MNYDLISAWSSNPLLEYVVDAWQRNVLVADVLRQRGNQFLEHAEQGKPAVLAFDHDVILDAAEFERPCNYLLLRVRPPSDAPTDPKKRPFVVFDPRAGHGPGIGGFKDASQVGIALRAGHPVYFVSFRPLPVKGQTLRDVAVAEYIFLEMVASLHPEADAKPAIVGNCQAGWAIMMLSAYAPGQSSVICVAGSPLSYWAGIEGRDPLRYLGGLMGGNWLAALMADAGAGIFDGANLVTNFESLNPANALIEKPYNLYSNVDTEASRFLEFERWWGGYFQLTREEIVELTSELFVGNKLASGRIIASDGTPIDLRRIKAPILVLASKGDNITPPPQALNWILDLYSSVEEIEAHEQVIVYCIHPSVGHLGIFVSAKVATREHAQFVHSLDMIESLAPGLYEMVVVTLPTNEEGDYTVRFETRGIDDLRAYDDGRADEKPFRAVAHTSEVLEGLYSTFVAPWVQAFTTEGAADAVRTISPMRQRYYAWSDQNPWMWPVRLAAPIAQANRREAPHDNPFRAAEAAWMEHASKMIATWTDHRDRAVEQLFKSIWANPLTTALAGEGASHSDGEKPPANRRQEFVELTTLRRQALAAREKEGGFVEAVLRILYAAARAARHVDARVFASALEMKREHPRFAKLDVRALKAAAREAALMVTFDKEAALNALPLLLPTEADRHEALDLVDRIVQTSLDTTRETQVLLERVRALLTIDSSEPASLSKA